MNSLRRAAIFFLLVLLACGGQKNEAASKSALRVAILLAPSGKGDRSYNDMALGGVTVARARVPINLTEVLPAKPSDSDAIVQKLAREGVDLIIGVGFLYTDSLTAVAPRFPRVSFVLLDGDAGKLPNVRSITFRPEEGCFLVGALAARRSTTGKLGFIAGMDIPIMHRFACGFVTGATYAGKDLRRPIEIQVQYIGSTPDAFSNPGRGRELALLMYSRGIDVIFHAAGKSGNGVIQAAKEAQKLVIGVDTDQSYLAPDFVLTSMRKRMDTAVTMAILDVYTKKFAGGVKSVGLGDGGVDYVPNTKQISPDLKRYIDRLGEEIVAGHVAPCTRER